MSRLVTLAAASLAAALAFSATPASALEGLHAKVRVGNKICFADHFHYGNGGGFAHRAAAMNDAVRSWAGFTAFEYGPRWANFALAASKDMQCTASPSQRGVAWSCNVKAIPCRN